jgi:hypothetical protein
MMIVVAIALTLAVPASLARWMNQTRSGPG